MAGEIPAQVAVHLARGIAESGDLVELEAARPERAGEDAAAAGAEVDCDVQRAGAHTMPAATPVEAGRSVLLCRR